MLLVNLNLSIGYKNTEDWRTSHEKRCSQIILKSSVFRQLYYLWNINQNYTSESIMLKFSLSTGKFLPNFSNAIFFCIIKQALSGDFQCICGKTHVQILLGVWWCVMSIFLFLKLYIFIKRIMHIHSIFKKSETNVFILHILTFKNVYNLQQDNV